jgi:glycosyltransferase involved in cell wall biosynthesis
MRILALVKSPDFVCCRYRVAAFRAPLERAGHHLDICGWPKLWFSRLLLFRRVQQADVVFVQRKLLAGWPLRLLRRHARRLVYDFDDALFLRDSYDPRGHDCPVRMQRFDDMIRHADAVIAGNDYLREQALPATEPHRIHVIPTCVNVDRYPLAPHANGKPRVALVWIGYKIGSLERLAPVLEEVGKNSTGLQLNIICGRSLVLQQLPVDFTIWRESSEATELAKADIGISWLPDDPWSRGKCGLRVLQYMAAGLPVVANPVGLQARLIRHGDNGFLVETAAEWKQAIDRLARDPALRRQMGRAGRRRVEVEYDVRVGAARWLELLAGLDARVLPRAS